ncbi:hypothetical protein [Piscirickettsia salmonis]|uniref:hypothetical protein n=1 Tax=Piscirickettsia salmonis TaxID=1238 RepID=UPI000332C02A|nr:hypothetical protein [Piscirickettsia salmonis]ERL62611.1 hypothetical protein K661_01008 [Piscirickettsia salmonis LF-89 = ATCC VR-1361]PEQ15527.1 hypothetical protein X973_12140 [Piscirickettsia salmonis]
MKYRVSLLNSLIFTSKQLVDSNCQARFRLSHFNLVPTNSYLDLDGPTAFLHESNSDWDINPDLENQEEIDSEQQPLSPTLFQQQHQHSQQYMDQCEQLMARIYQDQ